MNRFRKTNQKGFTMVGLMTCVVIVVVLFAAGIPLHDNYIKETQVAEATDRLGEIVTASKAQAIENTNAKGEPIWPSGAGGLVDLSATSLFTYAISAGGGSNARTTAFKVVATGWPETEMSGVVVIVTVPNIHSNGNAPVVSGT